jgi:hypothetical protein
MRCASTGADSSTSRQHGCFPVDAGAPRAIPFRPFLFGAICIRVGIVCCKHVECPSKRRGCRAIGKIAAALPNISSRWERVARPCVKGNVFCNVSPGSPLFLRVQPRVQGIGTCQKLRTPRRKPYPTPPSSSPCCLPSAPHFWMLLLQRKNPRKCTSVKLAYTDGVSFRRATWVLQLFE